MKNNRVSLCTVSETWLTDKIPNKFIEIDGFNIIRNDRTALTQAGSKIKRGGGVLTYISKEIDTFSIIPNLTESDNNLESQWLEFKLNKLKPIVVGNCYRPPDGNEELALSKLNSKIEHLLQRPKYEVFILGDFNIDLNKPSKIRKDFFDIIKDNGLTQLINDVTRQTSHYNTILDLIITNSNCISDSGILYNNISDHFQVYAIRKHIKKIKTSIDFEGRNYSSYNKDGLHNKLDLRDWTAFDNETDPNRMWDMMLEHINAVVDQLYPIKKYHINQEKEKWINDDIMHMIIEKDTLLFQAKLLNTDEAWKIARQARNRTKNFITRAKAEYIQERLDHNRDDPKKFWREINKILPNKKNKTSNIFLKDQTSNHEIDAAKLPDYINNFFADIGPNLAKKFTEPYISYGPIGQPQCNFMELHPKTVLTEIKKINIPKHRQ